MAIAYATFADPRAAMALYEAAFGAEEALIMDGPDGSIMHGELRMHGSRFMFSSEFPGFAEAPAEGTRSPVNFMLYVDDVDAVHAQAVAAGMTSTQEPVTQFWGDRTAKVDDGHGYEWTIGTQVEDVSPDEVARRAAAYAAEMGG